MLGVYLNFRNESKEVIAFYEEVFGMKADAISFYKDIPGEEVAEENKELVMNSQMKIHGVDLMISDLPTGTEVNYGNTISLIVLLNDVALATQQFEALSVDGVVTMPLQQTFWGATYGQVKDRFGTQWMFNVEASTK